MRVLILIAHANANGLSTSHRLAKSAEEALIESGNEVRVVDLVTCGFDKVATRDDFTKVPNPDHFDYEGSHMKGNENLIPEIRKQQEHVTWCTHLIVIGPMWFYRYPATFYAWTERVLNDSFGYTPTQFAARGPLKGKKAMCVITLGGFESSYVPTGPLTTIEGILYHVTRGHFSYCGMTCLRSQAFYECSQDHSLCDSPEIVAKWKQAVKNLDQRPELPFGDGVTPCGEGALNEGQRLGGLGDYTLDEAIKL